MTRRRKPSQAYDYRRYIFLVQCISRGITPDLLKMVCVTWEVEPVYNAYTVINSEPSILVLETLQKLAQHVIDNLSVDTSAD